jgi:hypothetical protein
MFRIKNRSVRCVFAAAALFFIHSTAYAQASRTWVSGVGDDANPCSRTAPCKTFAGAISKTVAGGEIDTLDPGGFGAVTITKAITIQSDESKNGGILASGVNGIVVQAGANDIVTIRGLMFNGIGSSTYPAGLNGIKFLSGAALHVEHCYISGFNGSSGFGILMAPSSGTSRLFVDDTIINDNGDGTNGGGIGLQPTSTGVVYAEIDNVHVSNNKGFGIRVADNGFATIKNSNINGNKKSGVAAIGSSNFADVFVGGSVLSDDGWDIATSEGAVLASGTKAFVHLSDNMIYNNVYGLRKVSSGRIYSFANNKLLGNTTDGTVTGNYSQL